MKILIVIDSLSGGGAEKLISDLALRLKSKGYYVDIVLLTKNNAKYIDKLEGEGIPVIALDNVKGLIRKCCFLYRVIRDGKYDIVHANLFPVIYYIAIISKLPGLKKSFFVMSEHNTDNRRRHIFYMRPIERFVYRQYSKIISISEMTQKQLKNWLKFSSKKDDLFTVIDNGVPIEEFAKVSPYKKEEIFPHYASGDILLGMIGSFTTQKNHITMLKVLEHLPAEYKLICVGEGPLMIEIQRESRKMNLSERVIFLGFRVDIAQIMHSIDIVVIPSIWEGFGLVAVEAMACGKPIVASNVPGLAEVVGQYGLLEDVHSPEKFAKRIQTLENRQVFEYYTQQSKRRALDYDIEKMVLSYENVYKNVIDQNKSSKEVLK